MKKLRRVGRPRAGAVGRRAHARRLLLVLIGMTRRLARLQRGEARAAYIEVERQLRALVRARPVGRRKSR